MTISKGWHEEKTNRLVLLCDCLERARNDGLNTNCGCEQFRREKMTNKNKITDEEALAYHL